MLPLKGSQMCNFFMISIRMSHCLWPGLLCIHWGWRSQHILQVGKSERCTSLYLVVDIFKPESHKGNKARHVWVSATFPLCSFRGNEILYIPPRINKCGQNPKSYSPALFSASLFKSVIDFQSLWSVVSLDCSIHQWLPCPCQRESRWLNVGCWPHSKP